MREHDELEEQVADRLHTLTSADYYIGGQESCDSHVSEVAADIIALVRADERQRIARLLRSEPALIESMAQALHHYWLSENSAATEEEIAASWQRHLRFTRDNNWEPSPRFLAQVGVAVGVLETWMLTS